MLLGEDVIDLKPQFTKRSGKWHARNGKRRVAALIVVAPARAAFKQRFGLPRSDALWI